ncbi:MAG: PIN domain-containing protein [Rothia sp. (in: high G+C Gram-positive bacteria)]|nr:PIN domain-containing protein [Rothia sp. (in: high G+C Gram-positive bacteria)]
MSNDVYKVVVDANLLLSTTLRDWVLMPCYESGSQFYQVVTSQSILDEFGYHWRKDHADVDDHVRQKIVERIKQCLVVVEGYPVTTPLGYPDKDDSHVHSAAVHSHANALITDDKKLLNFAQTEEGEDQLPYETMSCDDFLMQLTDYAPREFFAAIYLKQEKYWERQKGSRTLPEQLEAAGAHQFATYLKQHIIHTLP